MSLLRVTASLLLGLLAAAATAAPQSNRFEVDGVGLHYVTMGEGSPVVLVHGYTSSAASWIGNGVADTLAENHRVLILDARGHGKSDKPHKPEAYGEQMAADIIALLDHEGIERAHLVGYSMGALLTLKAITMAPERFSSAVLGGQGWSGEGGVGIDLAEQIAVALENGRGIEPLMQALNPEGAPPLSQEQIQAASAFINQTNDPLALAAVIRSAANWSAPRSDLQANTVPTIAVVGDRDPLITAVRNLAGNLAALQRVDIIIGATHAGVVRNPAYAPEFGELIQQFLSSVDTETGSLTTD